MLDKKKNHPVMLTDMTSMEDMLIERYDKFNHNASKCVGFHPDPISLRELPEQYELWYEFLIRMDATLEYVMREKGPIIRKTVELY